MKMPRLRRSLASWPAWILAGLASSCALAALASACSGNVDAAVPIPDEDAGDAGSDADAEAPGPEEVTFPPGFMWGSASAAFQVEKGLGNTDWGIWVGTPGKIKNGDSPDVGGPDALAHIDEDVALLVASGQNAYRFSIEWARIFPTREAFDANTPDPAAIAAYDALFAALKKANITPFVTLQHFTLPDWLSDPRAADRPQGWERPETLTAFATFCERAGARWGASVDDWVTINEPVVSPLAGYIQGSFPPGLLLQVERALTVVKNEARAHAACYDKLKASDTVDADGDGEASMIGIVQHQRAVEPEDPSDPEHVAAAERVRYVNNLWMLNAVTRGDWDDDFDGTYDGPNDVKADPTLVGRSDYIGINYYTAVIATTRGIKIPVIDAFIHQDHLDTDRPKTDFHWDIYPKGLRIVLDEAKGYGLPLIITENGIADSADTNRARYLLEHLYELGRAKAEGIDVRGYFYWSLLDNFEWAGGFCPRFGLHTVDRSSAARAARPSVAVYRDVATSGKVTRGQIAAQQPYGPPAYCD